MTVLGGPHARCYPEDARQYFDYVLGFTDRERRRRDAAGLPAAPAAWARTSRPPRQPVELPTLRERWKFVDATLEQGADDQDRADDREPGLPLHLQLLHRLDGGLPAARASSELRDDLAFLLTKIKNPIVGWHDPNFGVRFDDYMEAVEAAVPPGRMRHIAESSLSLLSEPHLKRLRKNGFQAILPGIESWYDLGNKSKTRRTGMDKVQAGRRAREHDPALHPLHPDQLRAGPRRRHGAGAVRADQDVHRPGARAPSRPTRCSRPSAGRRR